nr:MIP18 family protein galla-1-like [Halyomorpha halys]
MSIREAANNFRVPKHSFRESNHLELSSPEELKLTVYDVIRSIRDPEKTFNLENLKVVYEDGVEVSKGLNGDPSVYQIRIEFKPTVPHCSLVTFIGLSIRVKLTQNLPLRHKLKIRVKEGSHILAPEVNKQINDKERVAAAMEKSLLKEFVLKCIKDNGAD